MSALTARVRFLVGRRLRRARARAASARQQRRLERVTLAGAPLTAVGPAGGTLALLAHEDDDLLFQSVSLHRDIRAGRRIRSVYLTAGDDDEAPWYWSAREAGVRAAYAHMAGVADVWGTEVHRVAGQPLTVATLSAEPRISLVFVRLPDGGMVGEGGSRNGGASLRKLWEGRIPRISSVDGAAVHTMATLQDTLVSLAEGFAPDRITTLDHLGSYDDGDHSDHHTVAFLASRVSTIVGETVPHAFVGFRGYPIEGLPSNLSAAESADKRAAFYLYAASDHKTCSTDETCAVRPEGAWLTREYEVVSVPSV